MDSLLCVLRTIQKEISKCGASSNVFAIALEIRLYFVIDLGEWHKGEAEVCVLPGARSVFFFFGKSEHLLFLLFQICEIFEIKC